MKCLKLVLGYANPSKGFDLECFQGRKVALILLYPLPQQQYHLTKIIKGFCIEMEFTGGIGWLEESKLKLPRFKTTVSLRSQCQP